MPCQDTWLESERAIDERQEKRKQQVKKESEKERVRRVRRNALAKLTDEERKVLWV